MTNKITLYKTNNPKQEKDPSCIQVGSFRDDNNQKWYAIYIFNKNNKEKEIVRSVYLYKIMEILTNREIKELIPDEVNQLIQIKAAHTAHRKFLSDPKLEAREQVLADAKYLKKMVGQKEEIETKHDIPTRIQELLEALQK